MLNGERRVHSVIELSSSSSEDEPATSRGPSPAEQGNSNNNNNSTKKGSQLIDQDLAPSVHIKTKEKPSAGTSSSSLKNKTTALLLDSRSLADQGRSSSVRTSQFAASLLLRCDTNLS